MAGLSDPYLLNEARPEPLSSLAGAKILVEASYYLQQLLDNAPSHEPLLCALGGFPLALRLHIEANLDQWSRFDITPTFVFDGQSIVGKEETSLLLAKEALERTQNAWALYSRNDASDAVVQFGRSGAVRADKVYTFFQRILVTKGIQFQVAPCNACAQIAYYDTKGISNDAILASKEILLYSLLPDTPVFTDLNFNTQSANGLMRSELLRKLACSEDTFIDSLLMTGTSFLPVFPALRDASLTPEQPFTIQSAITMYRAAGHSIASLCTTFVDEVKTQDPGWKEKCMKAKMAIKHYVALQQGGSVQVANFDQLTGDNHEYIGLRLPQELYAYLTNGTLRLHICSSLSSMEAYVLPPLDGGEAEEYRKLVSKQLIPAREQALALIVGRVNDGRMNRVFQHKRVSVRFWYDSQKTIQLDHMNVSPRPQDLVKTWSVRLPAIQARSDDLSAAPGSIAFAILSLQDQAFATATVSKDKDSLVSMLKHKDEVLANTVWRFLHLRGYIDDSHNLTVWGKALAATLESLGSNTKLDEEAFLAVDLLKYDQLNARNRHEEWVGSSIRGSDEDKTHCLLIARCASLLKLRHKEIGYTGPLSKNLLAWHSIISAIRESDRDLTETVFAAMFLYAHADRKQSKWEDFGLRLPFLEDHDIALGIAVKTFLDDHTDPNFSASDRMERRDKYASDYLPHAVNFGEDLSTAFDFFDAVCKGVKAAGIGAKDLAVWEGAKKYLDARRT